MTTYISILRGINVSGQKLIKMEALRKMYENMGFHNVTTYVQSGNVVFTGNDVEIDKLGPAISGQIKKDFGFDVPVIVLTIDGLKRLIDNNPFLKDPKIDRAFLHITFLSSRPEHPDPTIIKDRRQEGEELFLTDRAVYLYCPNGYGRTKLTNKFLETKLKVGATTRNWKTTNELLKIADRTI